jgi:iron complex transport system substrate-binding protein
MSMNMCADMLLLQLVEPSRIASVTYLASRGMREIDPGAADGLRINHGTAEEILAQAPDLILAGDFSTAMTRKVAAQAGAPILEVKSAITFGDIRQITLQVGEEVGELARAEALIAQMDVALAQLADAAPAAPFEVAVWNGESSPGGGTLENTIVEAAGARNIVAPAADGVYATIGLEQLLSADPQFMLLAAEDRREPTVLGAAMRHRVIARRFQGRALTYPEAVFRCGVPQSAEAALELRRDMMALAEQAR